MRPAKESIDVVHDSRILTPLPARVGLRSIPFLADELRVEVDGEKAWATTVAPFYQAFFWLTGLKVVNPGFDRRLTNATLEANHYAESRAQHPIRAKLLPLYRAPAR